MATASTVNYWSLVTIIGPILLLAVLVWVIARNRRQTPRDEARTEQATRDVYAAEQKAHEGEPGSGL